MQPDTASDAAWAMMRPRLPTAPELAESARENGALIRRRGIRDAETLLRLALSYGACGLSLRGTAMWAEAADLASLSDVAVLNRLRGCAPWLATIAGGILSSRVPGPAAAAGFRVRLVDATTLSAPGSGGADWRVHMAYDLVAQRTTAITLSDSRGAESLRNFEWAPGDLAIGDRGYAKARDLAAVAKAGADFIVRTGWNALRLRARDGAPFDHGAPFDLFAALDGVPELGDAALEIAVALNPAGTKRLPARLVVFRKSAADAETSRDEARRKSRRQGKAVRPETLKAAGYILLITSLERDAAADILALYRLRWQIELVFKRLKSLLDLGALPAKDPDLARTWIYAKLIVALLLEDVTHDILDIPPCGRRIARPPHLALAPATRPA